jgi:hypothetical protein
MLQKVPNLKVNIKSARVTMILEYPEAANTNPEGHTFGQVAQGVPLAQPGLIWH